MARALSSLNPKSARSIFPSRTRNLPENDSLLDEQQSNLSPPDKKRSFIGSLRSKASVSLRSKRPRLSSEQEAATAAAAANTRKSRSSILSTRSRHLPRWDMSFLHRSQPIRMPAGKVEEIILIPSSTVPDYDNESHLQTRLRQELATGRSMPFSKRPTGDAAHEPEAAIPPQMSAFTFSAPAHHDYDMSAEAYEISVFDPLHSQQQQARQHSTSTASPETDLTDAASDIDIFLADKMSGLSTGRSSGFDGTFATYMQPKDYKPYMCQASDLIPADLVAGRVPNEHLQQNLSLEHASQPYSGTVEKRCDSGFSGNKTSASSASETSLSAIEVPARLGGRGHVHFSLHDEQTQRLGHDSREGSPTTPPGNITVRRARTWSSPRPPTPSAGIESMNKSLGIATDTFKETAVFDPLDYYTAPASSKKGISGMEPQTTSSKKSSVCDNARRSLDRMTKPREGRGSSGSDSISTGFEEVKDGGVKSVKAIVMDGMRGPKYSREYYRSINTDSAPLEPWCEDEDSGAAEGAQKKD